MPRTQLSRTGLAIETCGLVKRFGEVAAVDGLDLGVPQGGVFGLLGPNGAGKTTTIRILATLQRPDAGTARVFGHDIDGDGAAVRRRIGLTGQFASVDEDLTGRENLLLIAKLLGHNGRAASRRADVLLEVFGLTDAGGRVVKHYSGGMRRRLDIAASIVSSPDLIFLDEPTAGLDPRSRNQVWEIVNALVAGGTTVVLTTQYLAEADALANRIVLIDHGRVVAEGTPTELKASVGAGVLHLRLADAAKRQTAAELLSQALGADVVSGTEANVLAVRTDDPQRVADALAAVVRSGIDVIDFSFGQPSLDEVFLALTDHTTATAAPGDGAISS